MTLDVELGGVKRIASYHNYEKTPHDLDALLCAMQHVPADIYKIAIMAHTSLDSLRMLACVQQADVPLVGLCMGAHGHLSRLLGPVVGSELSYVVHERGVAPGEIHIDEWPAIKSTTAIYGLVGHPITHSVSDVSHNALLRVKQLLVILHF